MKAEEQNLHQSIASIMNELKGVGKNSTNEEENYKYRSIDDVMGALKPLLTKYRVICSVEVLDVQREERQAATGGTLIWSLVKVKYTLRKDNNDTLECVMFGEGMDGGDKSLNKALTSAYKYFLTEVFCIATDDAMMDSEAYSPKVDAPAKPKTPGDTPSLRPQQAASKIANFAADQTAEPEDKTVPISQEEMDALVKKLNYMNVSNATIVKEYGLKSLRDMTKEQYEKVMARLSGKTA